MNTIIDSLREIIGTPQVYLESGALDYGAFLEYFASVCLVLVVVGSVFKLILLLAK